MSTTRSENKSRHWVFTGRRKRTRQYKIYCFTSHLTLSPVNPIPRFTKLLKRKENSFQGIRQRPQFRLCYHSISTFWFGNINPIPFQQPCPTEEGPLSKRILLSLRIDSPMSNYCSHGTFLHFSLQSSHLNICYCYQDLHQSMFHPGLRHRMHYKPHAPLLNITSHL